MTITSHDSVVFGEYFLEPLAELRQVCLAGSTFAAVGETEQVGVFLLRELGPSGHQCFEDLLGIEAYLFIKIYLYRVKHTEESLFYNVAL